MLHSQKAQLYVSKKREMNVKKKNFKEKERMMIRKRKIFGRVVRREEDAVEEKLAKLNVLAAIERADDVRL